jgi:hypothetical protein
MANGDLARALAYQSQLPTDARALLRQWMNNVMVSTERDKERAYDTIIREEGYARQDVAREDQKRQRLQEWNRNETRYQDEKRRQLRIEGQGLDNLLIERADKIQNLEDRRTYLTGLSTSERLKSTVGYDLLDFELKNTTSQINTAYQNLGLLNMIDVPDFDRRNIKNLYLTGQTAPAYQAATSAIDKKFTHPAFQAKAKELWLNLTTNRQAYSKVDPNIELGRKRAETLNTEYEDLKDQWTKLYGASKVRPSGTKPSIDHGFMQINNIAHDSNVSGMFGGKIVEDLNPSENLRMGREISKSGRGWNNWTTYREAKNDPTHNYHVYKNMTDAQIIQTSKGKFSQRYLNEVNQLFGDEAQIAKAVIMAESTGDPSAININVQEGGPELGSKEWQAQTVKYISDGIGISGKDFLNQYGDKFDKVLERYFDVSGTPGKESLVPKAGINATTVQKALISFVKQHKRERKDISLLVPEGKHRGKKLTVPIVKDILKERERTVKHLTGRPGEYRTKRVGKQSKWLDDFAKQLGLETAYDFTTDIGAKKLREYYKLGEESVGEIDFSKKFQLTIPK